MKIRIVLSLFDGISCGQVALKRAGIEYDKYYASEIDKYPIYITQKHFPNTIQLGDVEKWKDWNIEWDKVDLLIGGSPCTNLSIAGNREGLKGEQSRLFYAYVDILNHIKKFNPSVKFLLENVESMSEQDKGIINNHLGCKPVMINSSLVSAQNRKRYYWANWNLKKEGLFGLPTCDIPQPQDKKIVLKDILESGMADTDKSTTLCATDAKGMGIRPLERIHINKHQPRPYACEPVKKEDYFKEPNLEHYLRDFGSKGKILLDNEKSSTLTAAMGAGGGNVPCVANEVSQKYYSGRIVGRPLDENGNRKDNANLELMQVVEISSDPNKSNTLTTVVKDNIVCEPLNNFVEKKYEEFAKENGYIPEVFNPYNTTELNDKSPTLSTQCGSTTASSSVLLFSKVRIGDKDYKFCEGDRNKNTELDYVGGIISGRDKWIKDDKNNSRNFSQGNRVYSVRGKSVCLNANGGGIGSKTGLYKINLPDGEYIIRKLTPIECERLQTLPDDYTKIGSKDGADIKIPSGARYKALGNGWTVDVITHIFSFLV